MSKWSSHILSGLRNKFRFLVIPLLYCTIIVKYYLTAPHEATRVMEQSEGQPLEEAVQKEQMPAFRQGFARHSTQELGHVAGHEQEGVVLKRSGNLSPSRRIISATTRCSSGASARQTPPQEPFVRSRFEFSQQRWEAQETIFPLQWRWRGSWL
jgi:hypothetical protein